jgi:hypothetical protein
MKYYFPKAENFKWTKSVWLIIAIFSAGMVAFYYEQIYTLVTFSLLVLITTYFYLNPKKWHGYFILAYFQIAINLLEDNQLEIHQYSISSNLSILI